MDDRAAAAWLGGKIGTGLLEVSDDLASMDSGGRWAVAVSFEGRVVCARFSDWRRADPEQLARSWRGPSAQSYSTSLNESEYVAGASAVRDRIATGEVYQVNLCRIMTACIDASRSDVFGLAALLRSGNPAPYLGAIRLPDHELELATASPELFIRRDKDRIESSPIKGTAPSGGQLTPKDEAENVMIVDLVRNDLSRFCATGTVQVPSLLGAEEHPGVRHLVSTVAGDLLPGTGWPDIFAAAFPPGSVTGAPKSSAVQIINELEPAPRDWYCGAIGWVDADERTAELAVGIRSFWVDRSDQSTNLKFGTGAGITWGSDPVAEWNETVLKAARLVDVASGQWQ